MATKKKQAKAKEEFYVNATFSMEVCGKITGVKSLEEEINKAETMKPMDFISISNENSINDYS